MHEQGAAANASAICLGWMQVPATPHAEAIAWTLLTGQERARAARFRVPQDRLRFVAGRAGLRLVLSEALAVHPAEAPLETDGTGMPVVSSCGRRLAISVSHAGEWAVAAVGSARWLGVDLEPMCAVEAVPTLMRRALTEAERADLARVRARCMPETLTRCWVAKEAILKAAGCGLAVEPQCIVLSIGDDGQPVVRSVPAPLFGGQQIAVRFVPAPAGYIAALAADASVGALQ